MGKCVLIGVRIFIDCKYSLHEMLIVPFILSLSLSPLQPSSLLLFHLSEKRFTRHKGHKKVKKLTCVSVVSWLILNNEMDPRVYIPSSISIHISRISHEVTPYWKSSSSCATTGYSWTLAFNVNYGPVVLVFPLSPKHIAIICTFLHWTSMMGPEEVPTDAAPKSPCMLTVTLDTTESYS